MEPGPTLPGGPGFFAPSSLGRAATGLPSPLRGEGLGVRGRRSAQRGRLVALAGGAERIGQEAQDLQSVLRRAGVDVSRPLTGSIVGPLAKAKILIILVECSAARRVTMQLGAVYVGN